MNIKELVKKRIQLQREKLLRMKHLGRFLTKHLDYEIENDAYENGFKKLMEFPKAKLITKFMTKEDVIFFNEFD